MGEDLAQRVARPVGELALPASVVPAATPARQVAAGPGGVTVVVDAGGRAIGLASAADLAWQLAGRGDDPPIGSLMQGSAALCDASAAALIVAARLQTEARAALGVIDAAGRPLGIVTPALAGGFGPRLLATAPLGDVAERHDAKTAQAALAEDLLDDGMAPLAILRLLAALDRLHIAASFVRAAAALTTEGWGRPPVDHAVIVMGSVGRGECLLQPDQDNGLILADYPDAEHGGIDGYFTALADRAVEDMAAVGFARCDGGVMAINPLWRKSLSQWQAQIAGWIRRANPQRQLAADIFFDFRHVAGSVALVEALQATAMAATQGAPAYLLALAWRQIELGSPLTPLGGIETDAEGLIDLKLWGSAPIVELTRALALRHGIAAAGTAARLSALAAAGALSADLATALAQELDWLTGLRLRAELAALRQGSAGGRRVAPEDLSPPDRERLRQLLRLIDRYREVVRRGLIAAP